VPQAVLPIAGIVIGNAMTGTAVIGRLLMLIAILAAKVVAVVLMIELLARYSSRIAR